MFFSVTMSNYSFLSCEIKFFPVLISSTQIIMTKPHTSTKCFYYEIFPNLTSFGFLIMLLVYFDGFNLLRQYPVLADYRIDASTPCDPKQHLHFTSGFEHQHSKNRSCLLLFFHQTVHNLTNILPTCVSLFLNKPHNKKNLIIIVVVCMVQGKML